METRSKSQREATGLDAKDSDTTVEDVMGTLNLREWTVREWTIRHHVAEMEFVGVDKSARCGKGGHCRSGQCGTMWQGWTMQEWKMQEWSTACEKCA